MTLELNRKREEYICYGFTLRRVKLNKDVTKELYFDHLVKIFGQYCFFSDLVYENTSGLHCHGIVKIHKNHALHRFRIRGWSLRLDELYDKAGWIRYINKDQLDTDSDDGSDYEPNGDFKMPNKKLFRPIPNDGEPQA